MPPFLPAGAEGLIPESTLPASCSCQRRRVSKQGSANLPPCPLTERQSRPKLSVSQVNQAPSILPQREQTSTHRGTPPSCHQEPTAQPPHTLLYTQSSVITQVEPPHVPPCLEPSLPAPQAPAAHPQEEREASGPSAPAIPFWQPCHLALGHCSPSFPRWLSGQKVPFSRSHPHTCPHSQQMAWPPLPPEPPVPLLKTSLIHSCLREGPASALPGSSCSHLPISSCMFFFLSGISTTAPPSQAIDRSAPGVP